MIGLEAYQKANRELMESQGSNFAIVRDILKQDGHLWIAGEGKPLVRKNPDTGITEWVKWLVAPKTPEFRPFPLEMIRQRIESRVEEAAVDISAENSVREDKGGYLYLGWFAIDDRFGRVLKTTTYEILNE